MTVRPFLRFLVLIFSLAAAFCSVPLCAQQISFYLKSAPSSLEVSLDGAPLKPVSSSGAIRHYRFDPAGTGGVLRFSAPGCRGLEYPAAELPLRDGLVQIKLEAAKGALELIAEYPTGRQPKSAYFSPDGGRLFVPLLDQPGIDVFRFAQGPGAGARVLGFEKRLTVPGGGSPGFVEAFCDQKRGELWVSNMAENKVHIFDLNTLEYKMPLDTGGVLPKVIVQSPAGDITAVSNWVSKNISVFNSGTKTLLRRIPAGGTPRGMAFSPDGALLYAAIYDRPEIAVIDMTRNEVTARFRLYEGEGAARHVIYRDGRLYVSDMYRGTVNIVDAATGALIRSRRVGPNINTIVLSPDGRHIFASSRGHNNPLDYTKPGPDFGAVYMLAAADLAAAEQVWGRNQPTGLAVSPDGKFLAFTDFLDANLELYRVRAALINLTLISAALCICSFHYEDTTLK
jgi:DNA-binding beta-propeller fold protein YncE